MDHSSETQMLILAVLVAAATVWLYVLMWRMEQMEVIMLIGIVIYSAVMLGIMWIVVREITKILEAGLDDIKTRLIVIDVELNKITRIVEQYDKNTIVQPRKTKKEREVEKPMDLTVRLDADEDYPRPRTRLKIMPGDMPYPSLKVKTDQEYPVDKWW